MTQKDQQQLGKALKGPHIKTKGEALRQGIARGKALKGRN